MHVYVGFFVDVYTFRPNQEPLTTLESQSEQVLRVYHLSTCFVVIMYNILSPFLQLAFSLKRDHSAFWDRLEGQNIWWQASNMWE